MSRWDATLNWGPDDGTKDEDEATAVVIAAAVRELTEQRTIWRPIIRAVLSPLTQVAPLAQVAPARPLSFPERH